MDIISELRYRAYRAQREAHPEKSPGRWANIFGRQAFEFEKRYQEEKEAAAAPQWLEIGPPIDGTLYGEGGR